MIQNKRVLFIPISLFIGFIAFFALWAKIAFWLYSTGQEVHDKTLPFLRLEMADSAKSHFVFHLFSLILTYVMFLTTSEFLVGFFTSYWYFKQNTEIVKEYPLLKSVWNVFRFHFGTVFLASLFYTLVWIIKTIVEYIKVNIFV